MRNKRLYLLLPVPVAIIILLIAIHQKEPICPDDYSDTDAGSAKYLADTDKWTNGFFDANPAADMGDWAKARHQFWVDNNCVEALKRYDKAKATGTN